MHSLQNQASGFLVSAATTLILHGTTNLLQTVKSYINSKDFLSQLVTFGTNLSSQQELLKICPSLVLVEAGGAIA